MWQSGSLNVSGPFTIQSSGVATLSIGIKKICALTQNYLGSEADAGGCRVYQDAFASWILYVGSDSGVAGITRCQAYCVD